MIHVRRIQTMLLGLLLCCATITWAEDQLSDLTVPASPSWLWISEAGAQIEVDMLSSTSPLNEGAALFEIGLLRRGAGQTAWGGSIFGMFSIGWSSDYQNRLGLMLRHRRWLENAVFRYVDFCAGAVVLADIKNWRSSDLDLQLPSLLGAVDLGIGGFFALQVKYERLHYVYHGTASYSNSSGTTYETRTIEDTVSRWHLGGKFTGKPGKWVLILVSAALLAMFSGS